MALVREKVVLPPPGWRPYMPKAVKKAVLARQKGRSAISGKVMPTGAGMIHYDHRPPLHERPYDEERNDTTPSANDPDFIFAITAEEHRKLSGRDWSRMCRTDRLRALQDDIDRILTKPCGHRRERKGTIKSRGFQKRHRPSRQDFGLED